MGLYFTSDTHFFHDKVIPFEGRPFNGVLEMNQGIIDNWNSVVKKGDTVVHVGDFCFGNYDKWESILKQLNGEVVLCKGNHDNSTIIKKLLSNKVLKEVHMIGRYMKVGGYILNLSHYPMEIGNRPRIFSIHGHIHSDKSRMLNQVNVGVDSPLFKHLPFGQPIPLEELVAHLDSVSAEVEELFLEERRQSYVQV